MPEKDEDVKVVDPGLDEDIGDDLDQEEEVEIDIDDKEEDEETPADKKFAEMRIENKELRTTVDELKQTVESLKSTPAAAPVVTPAPIASDDPRSWTEEQWDALAKSDWKKAVDLRSSIQAEDKYKEQKTSSEFERVQEESKSKVLLRHPELNDPNSEKAKIYRNIVTANPEYTVQKKGPLSAMYEMEDYMEKHMGYKREDIVKAEQTAREAEAARHHRVSLTSTPGRHSEDSGTKVTLTKDEVDFCKLQEIDPKVYATNKKKLAATSRGGIQL
jgi:hypothetical protein